MKILLITITLQAPWTHSLKEKRAVVKSLIHKAKNKFNISIAETNTQDIHQTITISVASISSDSSQSDRIYEEMIRCIENSTDASITNIEKEFL